MRSYLRLYITTHISKLTVSNMHTRSFAHKHRTTYMMKQQLCWKRHIIRRCRCKCVMMMACIIHWVKIVVQAPSIKKKSHKKACWTRGHNTVAWFYSTNCDYTCNSTEVNWIFLDECTQESCFLFLFGSPIFTTHGYREEGKDTPTLHEAINSLEQP